MLSMAPAPAAGVVYEQPDAFIAAAFDGAAPEPEALWMTPAVIERVEDILGHPVVMLRARYWRKDNRTAWILEEIGKEEPITAGFVVDGGVLKKAQVLIYRESRGWEVRYPAFTDQFTGATLEDDWGLSTTIDGISGATLSVRAMRNMARLALFLHHEVTD